MAKASANVFPYVHLAPAAAPASPAAGSQRLYLDSGDSNKLKRKDSAGTVVTIEGGGGGSGQGLKDFAQAKRTSGDITVNSTTFTNVDTGLDLVMTAAAGDVIECKLMAKGGKSTAGTTYLVFDFQTIVSGSPVNSVTSETTAGTGLTNSFPAWGEGLLVTNNNGSSPNRVFSGSKRYTLQAGDISGGTVTLRLRAFCGASCVVSANDPLLYVEATNLGPQL